MKLMFWGMESPTWVTILLLILTSGLLVYSFNFLMRKTFNLKKDEFVGNRHVNTLHKVIDRWIIVLFIALIFVGAIVDSIRENLGPVFLLQPFVLAFELIFVSQIVRIFMEWKHVENRHVYIARIVELLFYIILLLVGYKYLVMDNILNISI